MWFLLIIMDGVWFRMKVMMVFGLENCIIFGLVCNVLRMLSIVVFGNFLDLVLMLIILWEYLLLSVLGIGYSDVILVRL